MKRRKAVALRYKSGEDPAPRVVAKGKGEVAARIIELARESGIPVREDTDLVELLSAMELYQEIPLELYRAVAEVLVFLHGLGQNDISGPPAKKH
jgi:flagellar biosynthesis protein